jgi:hypothetical protein
VNVLIGLSFGSICARGRELTGERPTGPFGA